jgi:hypothetical protein
MGRPVESCPPALPGATDDPVIGEVVFDAVATSLIDQPTNCVPVLAKRLALLPTSMLRRCPLAEFAEKFCQSRRLVVRVESAGIGEHPGAAAAEEILLQADAGLFVAGDDAVRTDADEGDDRRTQAFYFRFEATSPGSEFVVGEFIGAGRRAVDDVRDPELEIEQELAFKRRKESRREAAGMKCGPEAVAGAAKVMTDRGGVEAGIDAGKEDDEILGDEIRNALVVRSEELRFVRFPRGGQFPIHRAVPLEEVCPRRLWGWWSSRRPGSIRKPLTTATISLRR